MLLSAATDDPAGFRLLFQQAAREPAFEEEMDRLRAEAFALTHRQLARVIPGRRWARWAAQVVPVVAIEAVTAWLDAGRPDREQAAERIRRAIHAVIRSAAEPRRFAAGAAATLGGIAARNTIAGNGATRIRVDGADR